MGRTDDQFPAIPGGPYLFLNGRRVVESQAEDAANSALGYGGDLLPSTTQGRQGIVSGLQFGTARNGDHIEFFPVYSGIPLIVLRGGILDEPRAKWGPNGDGTETGAKNSTVPVYPELVPLNLSPSGFDLRARLKQKTGGSSQVSDVFTAYSGTLSAAPSVGDRYTVVYDLSATNLHFQPGALRVVVKVNGGDAASRDYTVPSAGDGGPTQTWTNQQLSFVRSGLTTGSLVEIVVLQLANIANYNLSFPTVRYYPLTGGEAQYASMTPDADDFIEWYALGATADLTP